MGQADTVVLEQLLGSIYVAENYTVASVCGCVCVNDAVYELRLSTTYITCSMYTFPVLNDISD